MLIDANLPAQIIDALNFYQLSFLLTSTSIRIVLVQLQRIVYTAILVLRVSTRKRIPSNSKKPFQGMREIYVGIRREMGIADLMALFRWPFLPKMRGMLMMMTHSPKELRLGFKK